ncbi:hypothetical protein bpr_I0522 [Butyrivibrio proteoclasticus B316]|uniref:Uncharacterized protein n=1 Tax=Butyrivibrio proteoclasticus (strain ATCC 51982 / DSM 14932 / B316) TaxID=515622 RepID=E0S0E3_BUTPB|nr:DUF6056 family protein [Butyrivibrio proteoclasticus]ADL33268.1 hypothetical protein bpr_I0522 [Butyrivibrio proteoclasticus B316]
MFSYNIKRLSRQINTKRLSVVMTVLYAISVLPLLVLGHFNWMSADDMSMAYRAHEYYINSGNVIGLLGYILKVTYDEYMTWVGYFFSATLSSLSPGIFNERLYFLVVYEIIFILTLGVCYFFNALFVHVFKADKHLTNAAAMLTLILMIQSMPKKMPRVEAFYWHSGAINYMFMLGLGLFWVGLLLRSVYDLSSKRKAKLVWACILGFLLGGANYMTALELAIISVLVLIILLLGKISFIKFETSDIEQKKYIYLLWIPACLNLLGFVVSCLAPGNRARGAQVEGFGAVKSILISIYDVFDICINQYSRWEVAVILLMLAIIFWKLSGNIEHRFEHPFIFLLFALGMSASNVVPPLFATGNIEAGRIMSIFWAEYVVMIVLTVFYITAWIRQSIETDKAQELSMTVESSSLVFSLVLVLSVGSLLCIKADPHYYSATSAIADITSGDAGTYKGESLERLEILEDESVTDAVLPEYTVKPEMLFFSDVEEDKDFWINQVVARYYHKNSVVLRKN